MHPTPRQEIADLLARCASSEPEHLDDKDLDMVIVNSSALRSTLEELLRFVMVGVYGEKSTRTRRREFEALPRETLEEKLRELEMTQTFLMDHEGEGIYTPCPPPPDSNVAIIRKILGTPQEGVTA